MIKKIDRLLESYFNGTSTLEEERVLKAYFREGEVDVKHRDMIPLFTFFDEEKNVKAPAKRTVSKYFRLYGFVGAVASLLLLLMLVIPPPHKQDTFIVMNGVKSFDEELVLEYVNSKLSMVSVQLNEGLEPIRNAEDRFERNLYPVKKAEDMIGELTKY